MPMVFCSVSFTYYYSRRVQAESHQGGRRSKEATTVSRHHPIGDVGISEQWPDIDIFEEFADVRQMSTNYLTKPTNNKVHLELVCCSLQ